MLLMQLKQEVGIKRSQQDSSLPMRLSLPGVRVPPCAVHKPGFLECGISALMPQKTLGVRWAPALVGPKPQKSDGCQHSAPARFFFTGPRRCIYDDV